MDRRIDLFRQLVSISLGHSDSFSSAPSDADWKYLYETASKQTLLGFLFDGMDSLPKFPADGSASQRPSLQVYSRWALKVERIKETNVNMLARAGQLSGTLSDAGFRFCLLKGLGIADCYPDPSKRQCGDIDVWIDDTRQNILDFLKTRQYAIGDVIYHHCDAHIFDDVPVEVHWTPSWMNGILANIRLQRFFRIHAEEQFTNLSSHGFCVPTARFNAVYELIHIYRHVLLDGLGLRHLLDYYFILKQLSPSELEEVRSDISRLGLTRIAASVSWVEKNFFKLEDSLLPFTPDDRGGEFLLSEMITSGNFGIYDKRTKLRGGENLVQRFGIRMSRLRRFLTYYPTEVLSAPLFKAWQYLWRRRNGYFK